MPEFAGLCCLSEIANYLKCSEFYTKHGISPQKYA